jgi:hypothetical protein
MGKGALAGHAECREFMLISRKTAYELDINYRCNFEVKMQYSERSKLIDCYQKKRQLISLDASHFPEGRK